MQLTVISEVIERKLQVKPVGIILPVSQGAREDHVENARQFWDRRFRTILHYLSCVERAGMLLPVVC